MYINNKIYRLPKSLRAGRNTRWKSKLPAYIHKVTIRSQTYFKVHLERQKISKIKYFKTKLQAEMFVDFLKINCYF